MTLLDKVKLLIANMQRAITDLTAIKTALIGRGIELPEGTTTSDYANIITNMSSGGDSEAFWDTYQDNGNRRNYITAFACNGWTDETYNPKYPIVADKYERMFCYNDKITSTKVPITLGSYTERNNPIIFYYCTSLVEIPKLVVEKDTNLYGAFDGCTSLESIGIEGSLGCDLDLQFSPNIDKETIMQVAFVARDFPNEDGVYLDRSVFLAEELYEIVDTEVADERFPERFQGMLLYDVFIEKGWSC